MKSAIETAYDMSNAGIEQQERRVNELRTRGGTLLAAAAIAASVLGSQAARNDAPDVLGTLAVIAFVASVFCVGFVIWPHSLVFEFRGSVLLNSQRQVGASDDEALEAAIEWIERFHDENRPRIETMSNVYAAACVAVGVEIILWTLSVAGTLN